LVKNRVREWLISPSSDLPWMINLYQMMKKKRCFSQTSP
jgi:hypothetical protein